MEFASGFAQYLELERGRSPKTIQAYVKDVKRFRRWLDENPVDGLPLTWQEVKTRHARSYFLDHLKPSPSYFHRVHSSLNGWFTYLRDVEELEGMGANPLTKISKPKKASHDPPTLTPQEVARLIETAAMESRRDEKLRNWTLITLFYDTGLRVSAICAMNMEGIGYKDGAPARVTTIGKGNKMHTVVLGQEGVTALAQWLRHRKKLLPELPRDADTEAVWIVPAGKDKGNRVKPPAVRKMMKRYGNLAGITKNVHPHLLRHTCFTEAVRNGGRPHAIQEKADHEDMSTTGKYFHADDADREALAQVLPSVLNRKRDPLEGQLPGTQTLFGDEL